MLPLPKAARTISSHCAFCTPKLSDPSFESTIVVCGMRHVWEMPQAAEAGGRARCHMGKRLVSCQGSQAVCDLVGEVVFRRDRSRDGGAEPLAIPLP